MFRAVAPLGEQLAQPGIAQFFLPAIVALLLQSQRLVEHEAAHEPLLLAVGHQFVFEGLTSLHGTITLLVHER